MMTPAERASGAEELAELARILEHARGLDPESPAPSLYLLEISRRAGALVEAYNRREDAAVWMYWYLGGAEPDAVEEGEQHG